MLLLYSFLILGRGLAFLETEKKLMLLLLILDEDEDTSNLTILFDYLHLRAYFSS